MTLSWDTRYSSFDEDVAACPHFTTQPFVLRGYQVCCHGAKPRFANHQTKLHRIVAQKNPALMISFMESVY
jgi:hypothetical protein